MTLNIRILFVKCVCLLTPKPPSPGVVKIKTSAVMVHFFNCACVAFTTGCL